MDFKMILLKMADGSEIYITNNPEAPRDKFLFASNIEHLNIFDEDDSPYNINYFISQGLLVKSFDMLRRFNNSPVLKMSECAYDGDPNFALAGLKSAFDFGL